MPSLLVCSRELLFRKVMSSTVGMGKVRLSCSAAAVLRGSARCQNGINQAGQFGKVWGFILLLLSPNKKVKCFSRLNVATPVLGPFVRRDIAHRACCS